MKKISLNWIFPAGALLVLVPWIMTLVRDLGTERALKEREEERADMTAHLHDGVLQTLALIQLHADDQQTVFSLARQQERELREWLYQERTTSDRSVNAGLKQIAAHVEDTHGTKASACAREAISGITPPYRACSSMDEATTLESSSRPRTMAAAVSSQVDSIPSTTGSLIVLLRSSPFACW